MNHYIKSIYGECIYFLDKEGPTIDTCISPPAFLTSKLSTTVVWDEPTFHDNSGRISNITSTHTVDDTFLRGETIVSYTAYDEAGNNNTCTITITVMGKSIRVTLINHFVSQVSSQ